MGASDILTYLSLTRFVDSSWKGTAVGFLTHFQHQVRLYNEQNPLEPLTPYMQRIFLENAVSPLEDLHQVKATHSYEEYRELLIQATEAYDVQLGNGTKSHGGQQVHLHEAYD